jgi:hypothetical protein
MRLELVLETNRRRVMGIGTSLILIAGGAILRWAVNISSTTVNWHTVGIILMIVGGVGLLLSVFWMISASDRRRGTVANEPGPPSSYDASAQPRY